METPARIKHEYFDSPIGKFYQSLAIGNTLEMEERLKPFRGTLVFGDDLNIYFEFPDSKDLTFFLLKWS